MSRSQQCADGSVQPLADNPSLPVLNPPIIEKKLRDFSRFSKPQEWKLTIFLTEPTNLVCFTLFSITTKLWGDVKQIAYGEKVCKWFFSRFWSKKWKYAILFSLIHQSPRCVCLEFGAILTRIWFLNALFLKHYDFEALYFPLLLMVLASYKFKGCLYHLYQSNLN